MFSSFQNVRNLLIGFSAKLRYHILKAGPRREIIHIPAYDYD